MSPDPSLSFWRVLGNEGSSHCHPIPAALVITRATSLKVAPSGVTFSQVPLNVPTSRDTLTTNESPSRSLQKPRGPPLDRARISSSWGLAGGHTEAPDFTLLRKQHSSCIATLLGLGISCSVSRHLQFNTHQTPQVPLTPYHRLLSSASHVGAFNSAHGLSAALCQGHFFPPRHPTTSTSTPGVGAHRQAFLSPHTAPGQAGRTFRGSYGTGNTPLSSPKCS